jgi:uncharacterized protein (DUF924 family)
MNYQNIITFWFDELKQADWFNENDSVDRLIKDRFSDYLEAASKCELSDWRKDPEGRLAEIIVLDQFPRNIFRGDKRSFTYDSLALALSQEIICHKDDLHLSIEKRQFAYMPFMHSESRLIHEKALQVFKSLGSEESLQFEIKHKDIIDKFGRYPHRNETLGRTSSEEELQFLKFNKGF